MAPRMTEGARGVLLGPIGTASFFVLVHVLLGIRSVQLDGLGDVPTYSRWAADFFSSGRLVGIDSRWVYPIVALVPILLAGAFGTSSYLVAWILLATIANGVTTVLLARRRMALARWFIAFVLLLGPVTLLRIDEIVVPIAVAGLLLVRERPALAAALFTIGAWVKVWPALLLIAQLVASRKALAALIGAAATCAAVVGAAVALGARGSLFSFITAQATRGLQIEAPVAAPFLWPVAAGVEGARIYFDTSLLTYQVSGPGTTVAAAVMTPVLGLGVLAVVLLGVRARRRSAPPAQVLALTSLGLVSAVVTLNKVGSPQYMTWIFVPVLFGMLELGPRFRFPAVLVPVAALLTQAIYPTGYGRVVLANPIALVVLDVRDLLEVVLLIWVVLQLVRAPGAAGQGEGGRSGSWRSRTPSSTTTELDARTRTRVTDRGLNVRPLSAGLP